MDELSPPGVLSLDGYITEKWKRWKQSFDIFSLASSLSGKDAKVQAATFLHVAGPEALEVYNTFSPGMTTMTRARSIKSSKILTSIATLKRIRHKFNMRNQQPGESIDQYVTELNLPAERE